jgi:hypothetical protein
MDLTSNNNVSLDAEIPITSDTTMLESDKDGLVVYSERDVKDRVRKSICLTVGICVFLALVGMLAAATIHAGSRQPRPQTRKDVVSNNKDDKDQVFRDLLPSECFDQYRATVTNDNIYEAIEQCSETLYEVGCNGGIAYVAESYQLPDGGTWYVECYCDC